MSLIVISFYFFLLTEMLDGLGFICCELQDASVSLCHNWQHKGTWGLELGAILTWLKIWASLQLAKSWVDRSLCLSWVTNSKLRIDSAVRVTFFQRADRSVQLNTILGPQALPFSYTTVGVPSKAPYYLDSFWQISTLELEPCWISLRVTFTDKLR